MKKVINIVVGITHNITNFISWYKNYTKAGLGTQRQQWHLYLLLSPFSYISEW